MYIKNPRKTGEKPKKNRSKTMGLELCRHYREDYLSVSIVNHLRLLTETTYRYSKSFQRSSLKFSNEFLLFVVVGQTYRSIKEHEQTHDHNHKPKEPPTANRLSGF